jgi:hypothetical protein
MLRTLIGLTALAALTACGDESTRQADAPAKRKTAASTPVISLADAAGNACRPFDADGRLATVIIFLMRDCPVANASAPEMARLAADFTPNGIRFYGVYAAETAAEITAHLEEYGLSFPGLLDPKLELARLAGATRVPEAAVFSPAGELLYRGRIDDRAVRQGITKPVPHRHDLRLALEAVIAGRLPEPRFTESIGCHLPLE